MKTSRNDIERDRKQTMCFESSTIGYSTYKLRYGDLFMYKETYTDGTSKWRLAKCHGRIRPNYKTSGRRDWLILAQAMSDNATFTYERWIGSEDVMEITPKEKANKHILAFFQEQEELNYS